MSARVMRVLAASTPDLEFYSIDEAFFSASAASNIAWRRMPASSGRG
jgi:nucleotidyltransferase/DNA polymerase involved in DNA repair